MGSNLLTISEVRQPSQDQLESQVDTFEAMIARQLLEQYGGTLQISSDHPIYGMQLIITMPLALPVVHSDTQLTDEEDTIPPDISLTQRPNKTSEEKYKLHEDTGSDESQGKVSELMSTEKIKKQSLQNANDEA